MDTARTRSTGARSGEWGIPVRNGTPRKARSTPWHRAGENKPCGLVRISNAFSMASLAGTPRLQEKPIIGTVVKVPSKSVTV